MGEEWGDPLRGALPPKLGGIRGDPPLKGWGPPPVARGLLPPVPVTPPLRLRGGLLPHFLGGVITLSPHFWGGGMLVGIALPPRFVPL